MSATCATITQRPQKKTEDKKGQEVFEALADEEQGHVDYLESRLAYWSKEGKLDEITLTSALPSRSWIEAGQAGMNKVKLDKSYRREIKMLRDALKLEQEVSDHYRRLVAELDGDAQQMFQHFLEIEDGHTAIVQAEIDSLEGNGFWFDLAEFNLEIG